MSIDIWLSALFQFAVVIPAAVSCYLPTQKQVRFSPLKTLLLDSAVLIPYCLLGAWLCAALQIAVNVILLPSLVLFFFLYRRTVHFDLSLSLAVYIGVCAVQSFPGQFAYILDAHLHPSSSAASFSVEAAFFQFVLACLMPVLFAYPARHHFAWTVDHLNLTKVWYLTVPLSSAFLIFNVLAIPQSYETLLTRRISYLFPVLEVCALILLTSIYVLFYQGARILLERAELEKRSQLLEMQAHQYQTLQEYMAQTARLRHDFRHNLRLLHSLAEQGDIDSIQSFLAEYENSIDRHISVNYCQNAALNALFGYYHEVAVHAGISVNWKIALPDPLTVSELDLASLFGNLMENAVAGCQTLPESRRYFHLTSEIRHGNSLYIVSTNSFNGTIRKGKDEYRSTKHAGKGIGLASISTIAEKYHGSAHFSNSDNEFYTDIMIKI